MRLLRFPSWLVTTTTPWIFACVACSSAEPSGEACSVTAPSECPSPAVTYGDVAPIFGRSCAGCHTGKNGQPWSLGAYEDVADWQDLVQAEVLNCTMPPKDSGMHVSDEDRLKILQWVRCGALK
jgi:hypothetical protein